MNAPRFEDLGDAISPLARLAVIVAATGNHPTLLVGPPGVGTTMLVRRVAHVLPALDGRDLAEAIAAHAHTGRPLEPHGAVRPPLRMPHHTVSSAGMLGTGPGRAQELPPGHHGPCYRSPPRPGELALAHGGILFLDDVGEFRAGVIDAVRDAVQDGEACCYKGDTRTAWPARFALLAAASPCGCGWRGSLERACVCSPSAIGRHLQRLRRLPFEIVASMTANADDPAPRLGLASTDTIAGAVAAARRELARLPHRPTVRETLRALGYGAPDLLAASLANRAAVVL